MKKFKLKTSYRKMLADTITPVSIYLRLRDKFPNSLLLESSDYHGQENSYSFICCQPVGTFRLENGTIFQSFPDGSEETCPAGQKGDAVKHIHAFIARFDVPANTFNFITNGLFGYMSYDSVQYFEDIKFKNAPGQRMRIPEMHYSVFRYVIAINHFKNELFIFEHNYEGITQEEGISHIEYLIRNKGYPAYKFQLSGKETSNFTDEQFLEGIDKVKGHIRRGDVFQLVLSRRFSQGFLGDEFNVYRALRSVNPSPYLFYFDYGGFKIMGSSPEAQLVIKNRKVSIFPIAGTFKRTNNDEADLKLAQQLEADPKENSEHVMLVDLARNDLSRACSDVKVETFREVQYYSHVIHLVSKVTGRLNEGILPMQIVADTFPAGTLSGAPKYRAMELIDACERGSRGFYGGAIGFIGFNGDFNHAIIIRSFLSKDNVLHCQAGAGVVDGSLPENELNEVSNKLLALKSALRMAEEI